MEIEKVDGNDAICKNLHNSAKMFLRSLEMIIFGFSVKELMHKRGNGNTFVKYVDVVSIYLDHLFLLCNNGCGCS